jgi:hypothetical protein
MAKGSRTGDETPRRAKRRRRPAVLELKASEVKPDDAKPRQEKPDAKSSKKDESAAGSAWQRVRSQAGTMNFSGAVSLPLIATGVASAVAGALIVLLLMPPRVENADPRVGELAGEVANLSSRIESLAKRPLPAPAPDQSGLGERIDCSLSFPEPADGPRPHSASESQNALKAPIGWGEIYCFQ